MNDWQFGLVSPIVSAMVVCWYVCNMGLGAVKLLPWRPSRKFQAPQIMEDPALELKAAKAEREARFRATTAEPVLAPAADLAEIKRKRQEEARAAEEK